MPRRAADITQADFARALRAAKQAGASEVVVQVGDKSKIVIRLLSTGSEPALEESEEIIL